MDPFKAVDQRVAVRIGERRLRVMADPLYYRATAFDAPINGAFGNVNDEG